jgi:hypothetical protein
LSAGFFPGNRRILKNVSIIKEITDVEEKVNHQPKFSHQGGQKQFPRMGWSATIYVKAYGKGTGNVIKKTAGGH